MSKPRIKVWARYGNVKNTKALEKFLNCVFAADADWGFDQEIWDEVVREYYEKRARTIPRP